MIYLAITVIHNGGVRFLEFLNPCLASAKVVGNGIINGKLIDIRRYAHLGK